MDPGANAAAARVFADVLAEFAFLFGDPVPAAELPPLQGKGWLACLPFRGELAGSLAFGVPEGLALQIAANTLGMEPADPEVSRKAPDAIREVASVMGGHLASALAASAGAVELSPPAVFPMEIADWERLRADPATQCFAVNEQPALLRVDLARGGRST